MHAKRVTRNAAHKDYDEEKLVGIVRKTLRKMDADGHAAVLAMQLPPAVEHVVGSALKGR